MEHAEHAAQNFREGCNCAQAVFAAFCDMTGYSNRDALRLASSFGGGMGRLREVCGAVSGIFMVAGLLYGYDDINDHFLKIEHYKRIQELANAFREKHGSIVCREILRKPAGADTPIPEARTEAYYASRPCEQCIRDAASILDAYIAAHPFSEE